MVPIYNLADTFFIVQTHDDLQVAAVSLATPVFLLFMAVGTIFGTVLCYIFTNQIVSVFLTDASAFG